MQEVIDEKKYLKKSLLKKKLILNNKNIKA